MKLGEFQTLVGTSATTLRVAMDSNPDLREAIRKAIPGTESEMDARMEWYLGALPSKKGKALIEAEYGAKGMHRNTAELLWLSRMRYLSLRAGSDRKAELPVHADMIYNQESLPVKPHIRARKAALAAFLVSNPTVDPAKFTREWRRFELRRKNTLEAVKYRIQTEARLQDPVDIYVERRINMLLTRAQERADLDADNAVMMDKWQSSKSVAQFEDAVSRAFLCHVAGLSPKTVMEMTDWRLSHTWREQAASVLSTMRPTRLRSAAGSCLWRRLDGLDLLSVLIGTVKQGRTLRFTVIVGIDTGGYKHVLGFGEGPVSHVKVDAELIEDLQGLGLVVPADRPLLIVHDAVKELSISSADSAFRFIECNQATCGELLTGFAPAEQDSLRREILSTHAVPFTTRAAGTCFTKLIKECKSADTNKWLISVLKLSELGFKRLRCRAIIPALITTLERQVNQQQQHDKDNIQGIQGLPVQGRLHPRDVG